MPFNIGKLDCDRLWLWPSLIRTTMRLLIVRSRSRLRSIWVRFRLGSLNALRMPLSQLAPTPCHDCLIYMRACKWNGWSAFCRVKRCRQPWHKFTQESDNRPLWSTAHHSCTTIMSSFYNSLRRARDRIGGKSRGRCGLRVGKARKSTGCSVSGLLHLRRK